MIEPITQIDLDHRIYSKPKNELKKSIEQVYQVNRIKGVEFYKIIIENAKNKNNEKYIKNLCYFKIFQKWTHESIAYIALIISIISLIIK